MNTQPRTIRARIIGAIHAAAAKAGIDEDTRRALQQDAVGKTSCADMSEPELRRVLERIKGKMWNPQNRGLCHGTVPGSAGPRRPAPQRDKVSLVRKVYALLEDAGRPVSYAESILKHMLNDDAPDALEWAKPEQLWKLVCALEYDKKRRQKGKEK